MPQEALLIGLPPPDERLLVGCAIEIDGFPGFEARWLDDEVAWRPRAFVMDTLRAYFTFFDEGLSDEHPFERLHNSSNVYTCWCQWYTFEDDRTLDDLFGVVLEHAPEPTA